MKQVIKWGILLLILSFTGVGIKTLLFPAHVANETLETAEGVVDQTLDADNAIFNYENFKDLQNGAKAQVMNIEQAEKQMATLKETYGEPTTWTKDIREQYAHLQENIDGYTMQYQSLVKEYNANSSKVNRTLFKDKNLPEELPLDYTQLTLN